MNVSALQLQRRGFTAEVSAALDGWDLPAKHVELELTEDMMTGNVERVIATMNALKGRGLRISLDDFGTGYSSLNYLSQFPIDILKIDQSFVSNISSSSAAAGICRAIITLGHQLGMAVLAEGVETAAQVGYLRRNGCDLFQGYYFGKAVPATEAFELLLKRHMPHDGLEDQLETLTLLLVDNDENVLHALSRTLRREDYRILAVANVEEAFEVLARNDVQVVVVDQRMKGTNGTEFLIKVREMYPDIIRMVLSGYTELSAVTAAINQGEVFKFLTKPWDDVDLRMQITSAFRAYEARRDSVTRQARQHR
jgi:ActR/RegA family two-component response regulator